jgi:hypothetical protein
VAQQAVVVQLAVLVQLAVPEPSVFQEELVPPRQ